MSLSPAARELRLIWLTCNALDPFHIQLVAAKSGLDCELHILDQTSKSLWKASAIVRTGEPLPAMVVLEQPAGGGSIDVAAIRGRPSLRGLPIVVLGDPKNADAELRAYGSGADKFIPLPASDSTVDRLSRDIAQFWRHPNPPQGAAGIAKGA